MFRSILLLLCKNWESGLCIEFEKDLKTKFCLLKDEFVCFSFEPSRLLKYLIISESLYVGKLYIGYIERKFHVPQILARKTFMKSKLKIH